MLSQHIILFSKLSSDFLEATDCTKNFESHVKLNFKHIFQQLAGLDFSSHFVDYCAAVQHDVSLTQTSFRPPYWFIS